MRISVLVFLLFAASASFAAGPVLLVGIDTEFGQRPGDSSHGSIAMWAGIIQKGILANVTNGRTGILVIGGGKKQSDDVTSFWQQIGQAVGQPVTLIHEPSFFSFFGSPIDYYPFGGFAMIAVANSTHGDGVLTKSELRSLNRRQSDITRFLCNGGGLFASSNNYESAFEYLSGVYPITQKDRNYIVVVATALGKQLGFINSSNVGPWHTVFTSYPAFLDVLALDGGGGEAAAIGSPDIGVLIPNFSLQKTNYCLGEPIVADTTGTVGERDHFWSIQESDINWNRYGPELMRWMGGNAAPIDLAELARNEGLPLQCDRYYRIKLAVSGLCTSWVETTQLIYVSCAHVDAGPDLCCNDDLQLGNSTDDGNVAWEWSPVTDIDNPFRRDPKLQLKASFTQPKTYTVTGTNKFGCKASDSATIYCGHPSVQITVDRRCCSATLTAVSSPVATRTWNDGTSGPSTEVNTPGPKSVQVATPCGKASAAITIPADWFLHGGFPTLIAPAAFTPNGDGTNDVFEIFEYGLASGAVPAYNATNYALYIYDRSGGEHLVAHSDSNSCRQFWNGEIQWDGTINGTVVQQDTYSWRLVLKNCDGEEISKHRVRKARYVCTDERHFLWWSWCNRYELQEYEEFTEANAVTVQR